MPRHATSIDRAPPPACVPGVLLVGLVGASVATTCFGRALAHDGGAPAFAAAAAVATWAIASAILARTPRKIDRDCFWGFALGLAVGVVGIGAVLAVCRLRCFCDYSGAMCLAGIAAPSMGMALALIHRTIPVHDAGRLDARDAAWARGGSVLVVVAAVGVVLAPSLPLSLSQSALALLAAAAIAVSLDHDWGRWRRLDRLGRGADRDLSLRWDESQGHGELPRFVGATHDGASAVVYQRAAVGPFRDSDVAVPCFRLPGGVPHARSVVLRRSTCSAAAILLATIVLAIGARWE